MYIYRIRCIAIFGDSFSKVSNTKNVPDYLRKKVEIPVMIGELTKILTKCRLSKKKKSFVWNNLLFEVALKGQLYEIFSYFFDRNLTNLSKKVVCFSRSAMRFQRKFSHRLWKQRFEKNAYKILWADYP